MKNPNRCLSMDYFFCSKKQQDWISILPSGKLRILGKLGLEIDKLLFLFLTWRMSEQRALGYKLFMHRILGRYIRWIRNSLWSRNTLFLGERVMIYKYLFSSLEFDYDRVSLITCLFFESSGYFSEMLNIAFPFMMESINFRNENI